MGVSEEGLPGLSRESLIEGRSAQEPVEPGVGAAADSVAVQVPLAATNQQQVDRLLERIPIGESKLEHRFGPRQRIGSDRGDIKAPNAPTHC